MTAQTQNAGLARMTAALIGLNWWFQWGTGTGAAATANAVTTTTTTEARVVATPTQATSVSPGVTNDTLQLVGTIVAAGARAITEVGAFDAAGSSSPPTGGNMDVYGSFAVINLGTGDGIAFTMTVTYS